MANELDIRSFQREDQTAVRSLILDGLTERWGRWDPAKNPDLNDIASSYASGFFRVAVLDGRIVGSGALIPSAEGIAEIRRMSVARPFRGRGIGGAILNRLVEDARSAGCRKIILETTSTWTDAIAFYRKRGFRITHIKEGDTYFALELNPDPASMV
jgi:GNAT superfamily N-acetyltransferase